jgi:hypothetical protein
MELHVNTLISQGLFHPHPCEFTCCNKLIVAASFPRRYKPEDQHRHFKRREHLRSRPIWSCVCLNKTANRKAFLCNGISALGTYFLIERRAHLFPSWLHYVQSSYNMEALASHKEISRNVFLGVVLQQFWFSYHLFASESTTLFIDCATSRARSVSCSLRGSDVAPQADCLKQLRVGSIVGGCYTTLFSSSA